MFSSQIPFLDDITLTKARNLKPNNKKNHHVIIKENIKFHSNIWKQCFNEILTYQVLKLFGPHAYMYLN